MEIKFDTTKLPFLKKTRKKAKDKCLTSYYFTNGFGIAMLYGNKTIHLGCINDAILIPHYGIIIQTNICEYKHSGKHQYFLWDYNKNDLYKENGHDWKNKF